MKKPTKNLLIQSVLVICAAASLTTVPRSAFADAEVYQKTLRSTAWVLAKTDGETSSGTGVLVDDDRKLVLTNFHVVGEARVAVLFFPEITDGKPEVSRQHYLKNVKKLGTRGRVVAVDRKRDLAVIELDKLPSGASAIPMAAKSTGPGEDIQSIGNAGSSEALWVFTSGTVRSVYKKKFRTGAGEHQFTVVETQSPINSGDSGGPVVNNKGELVAVTQAISPKARLISYSVDIAEVKSFLSSPWKPAPLPIKEIMELTELEFTKHEKSGHMEVQFDQKNDEKQAVFIAKDVEYYERADIRRIWSLAATLTEAPDLTVTMRLLQQSARTKIGAWTVEETPQGEFMVIYSVKLDATAAPDAVRSTMEYVAKLTSISKRDLLPKETVASASETLDSWLNN